MRQLTIALLALLCAAGLAAAAASGQGGDQGSAPAASVPAAVPPPPTPPTVEDPLAEQRYIVMIERLRRTAWRWQRVMGVPLTRPQVTDLQGKQQELLRAVAVRWHRIAYLAWRRAENVPHKQEWLCIHRYEGSWTAGGGPYYGGLQMDWGFMARYGAALLRAKGPADNWTPLEQMWVAEHAYESGRGFSPWPNTARACGLL